jgi:hypothetical protein
MSRFRETLWFKKGEGAPEIADGDFERPLEDRYDDDGSLTMSDSARFSVQTADLAMGPAPIAGEIEDADKTMRIVVGEMHRGRRAMVAMACAMAGVAAVVVMFVA